MTYIHGYERSEADRLSAQAEFWRERIILPGTDLRPGTRLLEIGCGVGAVLGILADAFPCLQLTGVDVEPAQIAMARERLADADLFVADGRDLPFPNGSFDHVWIEFVLEHMKPVQAREVLAEARRVLMPGGRLTAIEADYRTLRLNPSLAPLAEKLMHTMETYGQNDAGEQLSSWLTDGGWTDVRPGAHHYLYRGADAAPVAVYLADAMAATSTDIDRLDELRRMGSTPDDSISYTVYKTTASR